MKQTLHRRALLQRAGLMAASVPLTALAVDGMWTTPRRLVTTHHAFGAEPIAGREPLRVMHVSDLHLHSIGKLEQLILEQLHETRPDLVVLTGDSVDRPAGLAALETFLQECPRGPRVLAIPGNWEYRAKISSATLRACYERQGVELLINQAVTVEKNGARLRVTGLDALRGGNPNPQLALADLSPAAHHLMLIHCPVIRDRLQLPPGHCVDLVLAGHTHGGQIAPWGRAIVLPPGSGRYVSGWYRDGGPPLYISRGLGTSGVPIRLGSTPELACIDWHLG